MLVDRRAIIVFLLVVLCGATRPAHTADQANSISNLAVKKSPDGRWSTQFDYSFNGEPHDAVLQIEVRKRRTDPADPTSYINDAMVTPQLGSHHVDVPVSKRETDESVTVTVTLRTARPQGTVFLRQELFAEIDGPADKNAALSAFQARNERDLTAALRMIDEAVTAADLQAPRSMLEQVLERDPRFVPAYVELARIAMKTGWGPDGLHQAEVLLDSALKIEPDSANAKILQGYVYAHQKRYPAAEALFVDAARSNPPNLWLWANWGELLVMQAKQDEAIAKYREVTARPNNHDSYERARLDAYQNLLKLLAARNDADGMEAVYEQHQRGDSMRESCITAGYARFMLNIRGSPDRAISIAREIPDIDCDGASSRNIIGVASYLIWTRASGKDGTDALNQARIYLPPGARAFYLLASSGRTMPAARKLLDMGESIDRKDNEGMTALGQALQARDSEAAERLLNLGAHADVPVGVDDMPVALIPVFGEDLDTIRALRRGGVDYSKIRYRNATALDFARRTGDEALLQALTGKQRTL